MTAAQTLDQAKSIVIKVGSVLIRDGQSNVIRTEWFNALAKDIDALIKAGKQVIIVSSGGVALGRSALGIALDMPPGKIPLAQKQAASAVGQYHMYHAYHTALAPFDHATAQVLLTLSETENRRTHLNARTTLQTLLDKGIIPIINENDSISTEEIRFGDNDRLAVRVAQMMNADTVILLSTIDGLYTDNPATNPQAEHIPFVPTITAEHESMAGDATPGLSTGGMKSKIQAAIHAVQSGINLIITDGQENAPLTRLQNQTVKSTLFAVDKTKDNYSARKRFLASHLKPAGEIIIDDGACTALQNGKSLLPVGVLSISGDFQRGDIVSIHDKKGHKIATGITAYNAADAQKLIGRKAQDVLEQLGYLGRDELVHRNDLALYKA